MTNREIAQEISNRIGNSPVPFNSVYSIALQIYNELGGEQTQFDSVYSILLEILPLVEGCVGGNAIEEVDDLPEDVAGNKDKFFRVKGGEDVYVAKLLSSETTTTNKLPDEQQIDKAYLWESENDRYYYKGAYKIICSDGELNWHFWRYDDAGAFMGYASEDNAALISSDTRIGWITPDDENFPEVTETYARTIMSISDVESMGTIGDEGLTAISAIYNAPESAQIGNAYIEYDAEIGIERGIYTGEEVTFINDGEEITGYKWEIEGNDNYYFATPKRASEIYYNIVSDDDYYSYQFDFPWFYTVYTDGGEGYGFNLASLDTDKALYIPQLNAPESKQAGSAYILASDDATGDERYYTGTAYTLVDADGVKSYIGYAFSNGDVTSNSIFTLLPANEIYNANADDIEVYVATNTEYELLPNNTIKLLEEVAEWYKTTLSDRLGVIDNTCYIVKYQREEVIEEWGWEVLAYYDELADKISEKANQTDFVVPVDMTTQAYDWSALDSFNTTGFYKGIAHADYMGMSLDFAAIQLSVVTASPVIIQTVAMYTFLNGVDNIQMGSRQSTDGGTTWTTMTESMLPSLNDDASVTSAVANKTTYSRSKIDSLIHALDVRLNALEGNTTVE